MGVFPLTLGALAVASGAALVTFDIIFAITLSTTSSPTGTRVIAIVASGLGSVSVALLLLLVGRQIRYRNGAHIKDFGYGKQYTYLLAGFSAVFGVLSTVISALELGMMRSKASEIPQTITSSSTESLVIGCFIVWAVALLSQAVFILCMVIIQRRDFQQTIQRYQPEETPEPPSEMKDTNPSPATPPGPEYRNTSIESPPSSSGRSRAGSDTIASFRSSISQVVRPITSKTKLINRPTHRPTSTESSTRETSISIEDGFDSWDTSAVDFQSRHAVESASPTHPRFLETIPASPTTSRSASPGFPLDLEPPKQRQRSRSYSPANSYREPPKSRTTSPTESMNEAHIHPLFRTDSPTPPPPTTPGTVVTAAPGAGQLISDRASIRRMRSGSLPSSPLMHQDSLDNIRADIVREEEQKVLDESGVERQLTPPIPEWILSGAPPRSSMSGYSRRKPPSLRKVGEVRKA
ncbi:hypothetical protein D0Z07_1482 [Hyphodiscus hymeniophilus]|uniref:Uncharacterized protein n=1 Tax=Hyphodiscus hymeniophilus TaxID=353542 RepID=A0A9P6VQT1_9HELO|nr:hypothetical protein D0Z07_1482 [Hyphodiscus hymeniophilus]